MPTPNTQFLTGRMPFLPPKALKAKCTTIQYDTKTILMHIATKKIA